MAGSKALEVSVLNQTGALFKGQCQVLFVPTDKGEVAIMPEHTPLILLLQPGEVSVVTENARKLVSKISHGLVYVGENQASVLIAT